MLELKNADGTHLNHTFGGWDLHEAARVALVEFGSSDTVTMLPATTRDPNEFVLLAVMDTGHIYDSTMRLVGTLD